MTTNLPAATAEQDTRDLETLAASLANCALNAQTAAFRAGLWADIISQQVEHRLGTGPSDHRNWTEPDYAAALDALGRAGDLREHIAAETAAILAPLVEPEG